jgi:hypothetical protein
MLRRLRTLREPLISGAPVFLSRFLLLSYLRHSRLSIVILPPVGRISLGFRRLYNG